MNNYSEILQLLCQGFANYPKRIQVERVNNHEFGIRCDPADQGKLIGRQGGNAAILRNLLNHRLELDGQPKVSITILTCPDEVASVPEWSKSDWGRQDSVDLHCYFQAVLEAITRVNHKVRIQDQEGESKLVAPETCLPLALRVALSTLAKASGRVRGRKVVMCFEEK